MAATYVHDGDAIDYRPSVDVAVGDVVVVGKLVGVARQEIKAGQLGSLALTGVFEFPKPAELSITAGTQLYWDRITKAVSLYSDDGVNARLGTAVADAPSGQSTIRVRLVPSVLDACAGDPSTLRSAGTRIVSLVTGSEPANLWTPGNCTLAPDTDHFIVGDRSLKITTTGAVTATAKLTFPTEDSPSVIPPFQCGGIWLYVSDPTRLSVLNVELWGDSNGSSDKRWTGTVPLTGLPMNSWFFVRFHGMNDPTKTLIARDYVTKACYAVRLVLVTAGAVDVYVGHLFLETHQKARVCFVLDACYRTAFTPGGLYDRFRMRGYPVTFATCPGLMGWNGGGDPNSAIITWEELARYAAQNNNDVSWHSWSRNNEASDDEATIRTNAVKVLETLRRHGHNPVWRAAWLSNSGGPNYTAISPFVIASATGNATEYAAPWPPLDVMNVPRFGVHMGTSYRWSATFAPGLVVLGSNPGAQVGDTVSVHWNNGASKRTGCIITAIGGAGNTELTLAGGTGDALPSSGSCYVRDFSYWQRIMTSYYLNAIDAHRPFVCLYTHGYQPADIPYTTCNDITEECLTWLLSEFDARVAAGTLEFVTIPMLLARTGVIRSVGLDGRAWWLYSNGSGSVGSKGNMP